MFTPGLHSWRSQLERMRRSYERLKKPTFSSVEYEDDLQHFLQDCWHLKDWIKNDSACTVAARVEAAVGAEPTLLIVGDLANTCKHMVRTRLERTGAYAISNSVTIHLGQNRPADITYTIATADGTTYDAHDIARNAMDSWSRVLIVLGLA
jgi:hypothetical protein